jgi:DNA-binding PucR family transcriptional regulator
VPDPDRPGRRAQLDRAAGPRHRIALGPTVGWRDAALSLARARALLALAEEGAIAREGLLDAAEHATPLLLRSDRRLAHELARARLAPLAGLPAGARTRLTATLRAWLAEQGRLQAVAERLHVHPQTVRYRLGQLRELFGEALEDPDARFELELALRVGSGAQAAGVDAGSAAGSGSPIVTRSTAISSFQA